LETPTSFLVSAYSLLYSDANYLRQLIEVHGPANPDAAHRAPWRDKLYEIIFDHHTSAGRLFDRVLLILLFLLGVLTVLLDSVSSLHDAYGPYLRAAEWGVTILFTLEYAARLLCAPNFLRYASSFFGVVDLLAIAPTFLGIFLGITHSFTLIRTLRLLRVFRILKLTQFLGEATALKVALRASLPKITVFLFTVLTVVILVGALMYSNRGRAKRFHQHSCRNVLGHRHGHPSAMGIFLRTPSSADSSPPFSWCWDTASSPCRPASSRSNWPALPPNSPRVPVPAVPSRIMTRTLPTVNIAASR
jgi:hypothetical protein